MANLPKQDTGIDGMVYVSTAEAPHAPCVKWYPDRPARRAPCLSVTIGAEPQARNHHLPVLLAEQMAPRVIAWIKLNHATLIQFWEHGVSSTRQEVAAHLDGLQKLGN